MASGIAWNEDYEDPESDVARAAALNGVALTDYLAQLPRVAPPGPALTTTRPRATVGRGAAVGDWHECGAVLESEDLAADGDGV